MALAYAPAVADQQTTPPGWYRHPTMVNTLCYWDGAEWTDKVQPATEDQSTAVASGIFKALAVLAVLGLVLYGAYSFVHADDDMQCSQRNLEHAMAGEPNEDC